MLLGIYIWDCEPPVFGHKNLHVYAVLRGSKTTTLSVHFFKFLMHISGLISAQNFQVRTSAHILHSGIVSILSGLTFTFLQHIVSIKRSVVI